jgi:hypothetical protein
MNAVPFVASIGIAGMFGAWLFSIPGDPVPIVYNCSEVIKSEDIRYVPVSAPIYKTPVQNVAAQTPLPVHKSEIAQATEKAKPKIKSVCHKVRKWYWNKKKKRKMYHFVKVC